MRINLKSLTSLLFFLVSFSAFAQYGYQDEIDSSGQIKVPAKELTDVSTDALIDEILKYYLPALDETEKLSPNFFSTCANPEVGCKDLNLDKSMSNKMDKMLSLNILDQVKIKAGVTFIANLNPLEKELLERYPKEARKILYLGYHARKKAESLYSEPSLHMGTGDAFRHTYWNALLAKYVGSDFAKAWATAHEMKDISYQNGKFVSSDFSPKNADGFMDILNNNIGRTIGLTMKGKTDKEIEEYIAKQISEGKLYIVKDGVLTSSN